MKEFLPSARYISSRPDDERSIQAGSVFVAVLFHAVLDIRQHGLSGENIRRIFRRGIEALEKFIDIGWRQINPGDENSPAVTFKNVAISFRVGCGPGTRSEKFLRGQMIFIDLE